MAKTIAKIKIKENKKGTLSFRSKSKMTAEQQTWAVEALRELADKMESQLPERDDRIDQMLEAMFQEK